MAQATIRDVAREAEVSVASVSRALNGAENIRADTRARVVAAAEKLGYVPHAGARSLSMARAHAIGVVLPDLHGEFFSEIVRGMDKEASARGFHLLLSNMHADLNDAVHALRAMRGRVDGLVVMAPHLDAAELMRNMPQNVPAVLVNCRADQGTPALLVDNVGGADTMVRHLLGTGRRAIAHVTGPSGNLDAEERLAGFRLSMRRHAGVDDPLVLPGDFSEEAGAAATRALIAGGQRVDAIFAANDMMAIGCMLALREAGVSVPEQIAVAGFDDIPVARYLHLTTMRVPIAGIGALAVTRLTDQLSGRGNPAATELHAPELEVRATTTAHKKEGRTRT
ncbi:LacI family DNA-binding transcriptional regulator [Sphingomonas xinjiangensis]|uniref:LacI family transcriptional regulator n=1 Tax=Sphingomonas xinjiangensis TaxID=643568 RepID=A0A840YGR6_9SPHN|nr:LacI family DNA-binding transcriptional regulator [Sphingomonas xinjiangensis]MBB5712054.1 LacI family transcriptional regulator [Sphingomonas xinjiangensis]